MRVIAGNKKGQPLLAVPGHTTRPTTDKVKEAIFNLMGNAYFRSGLGLDLYAGTGALGIEALSRGIEKVIFVDRERKAIEVIKQNLTLTGYTSQSEVYRNDAMRALKALCKRGISFDLILLDPPYERQHLVTELAVIDNHELLKTKGNIIVETTKEVNLPNILGTLYLIKAKEYGETVIRIYGRRVTKLGK